MKEFIAVLIAENIDRKPTQRHVIVDSLDLDMPILISNGLKKFKPAEKSQEGAKLWSINNQKQLIRYKNKIY